MDGNRVRTVAITVLIAGLMAGGSLFTAAGRAGARDIVAAQAKQVAEPLAGGKLIRVQGQATVQVAADEATVQVGAVRRDKTAQGALSQAADRMDAVVAAVKAQGVPQADINRSSGGLTYLPDSEVYVGTALGTIELKDGAVSKAGAVVDASVKAGAEKCAIASFSLKEDSAARQTAQQKALADARQTADRIASGLGVHINGVASADEAVTVPGSPGPYSNGGPPPYYGPTPAPFFCPTNQGPPGGPPPVPTPQVTVTASVTVTYTFS